MTHIKTILCTGVLAMAVVLGQQARAAVSAEEAAKLKSELTPFGAERAGNKDGTIPAWTGGLTTPTPGLKNGGRRPDPFSAEKPLFSIDAKNMAQYADKLSDGVKALMKKYPGFRIDVYPTHRTAAAPQWVYDNTFKNATRAKIVAGAAGPQPEGAYGGIPFPIAKTGIEAIWNHELRWRGYAFHTTFKGYLTTADGKRVLVVQAHNENLVPYYNPTGSLEKFGGESWLIRSFNSGPPIRAGEGIVGRLYTDEDKNSTWVYLTGQRRVRKLPNSCCDTPTPFSAGLVSFDEVNVFTQRKERFNWKLLGKKEMYIPYNSNRTMVPTSDAEVVGDHFLNPDHVRWELHRVWVVEATLKPGQRHTSPRSRYYLDEDTWMAVLADRWDANGQLSRMPFQIPIVTPDLPGVVDTSWGVYDLLSGTLFVNVLYNESQEQLKYVPSYPDSLFTPDGLVRGGVR
jgi:hypothetical protein